MYLETVDLDRDFFFQRLEQGGEITTSQPAPGALTDLWEALLKDYDGVLYLPMTSGLSSSYQTALSLAEEYEGKVAVVDTRRISVLLWQMPTEMERSTCLTAIVSKMLFWKRVPAVICSRQPIICVISVMRKAGMWLKIII